MCSYFYSHVYYLLYFDISDVVSFDIKYFFPLIDTAQFPSKKKKKLILYIVRYFVKFNIQQPIKASTKARNSLFSLYIWLVIKEIKAIQFSD